LIIKRQGRGYNWKGVEVVAYVDNTIDALGKELVDKLIKFALDSGNKDWGEDWPIIIYSLSSGYYDAGVYSGAWEDSYPEEGDDCRELDRMTLDMCDGSGTEICIDKDLAEEVFKKVLESHVMEVELGL